MSLDLLINKAWKTAKKTASASLLYASLLVGSPAAKPVVFGTVAAVTASLAGCSSKPSESDAERIVKQWADEYGNGFYEVVSVKKTDGQEGEFLGVKIYRLEYEARLKFLKNCYFGHSSLMINPNAPSSKFYASTEGGILGGIKKVFAGQEITVKGMISFEKTERGWRPIKW